MSDITKCSNHEGCTAKNTCRRFTATTSTFNQSWTNFDPEKGVDCSGYCPPMSMEEIKLMVEQRR